MNSSSQEQPYLHVPINGLLSRLKDNLFYIIFFLLFGWYAYGVHMDSKQQNPDDFISLSEAWENLKSGKYMHEMVNACNTAKLIIHDKRQIEY